MKTSQFKTPHEQIKNMLWYEIRKGPILRSIIDGGYNDIYVEHVYDSGAHDIRVQMTGIIRKLLNET